MQDHSELQCVFGQIAPAKSIVPAVLSCNRPPSTLSSPHNSRTDFPGFLRRFLPTAHDEQGAELQRGDCAHEQLAADRRQQEDAVFGWWGTELLPRHKFPVGFWSSTWCFYEIGVGRHHKLFLGESLFHWQVQFLHTPNTRQCSKNSYREGVRHVFTQVAAQRPREFRFKDCDSSWVYLQLVRRYYVSSSPPFTPELGGRDLAWLINETLPRIAALGA